MPREKEAYRDNLESLLKYSDNKHLLNVKQVSDYLGICYRFTKKQFPFKNNFIAVETLARLLS